MINAHLEEEEGKDKTGTEEVVSGKDNWSKRGREFTNTSLNASCFILIQNSLSEQNNQI